LSQIKRQFFLADTTLAGQFSFKVTPETFKPIYMVAMSVCLSVYSPF